MRVKLINSSLVREAILIILRKYIEEKHKDDKATDKTEFLTNDAINKVSPLFRNILELSLVTGQKSFT